MGASVSHTRLLVVVACALLAGAGFAMRFGLSGETLQYLVLTGLLAWASLEDLRSRRIPNPCVAAAATVRLAWLVALVCMGKASVGEIGYYVASGVGVGVALLLFALAFERLTGREGMGGGDVKLYAVAGLYLGVELALVVVLLSCVFALAAAFLTRRSHTGEGGFSRALPFGPAIAVAFVVTALATA